VGIWICIREVGFALNPKLLLTRKNNSEATYKTPKIVLKLIETITKRNLNDIKKSSKAGK